MIVRPKLSQFPHGWPDDHAPRSASLPRCQYDSYGPSSCPFPYVSFAEIRPVLKYDSDGPLSSPFRYVSTVASSPVRWNHSCTPSQRPSSSVPRSLRVPCCPLVPIDQYRSTGPEYGSNVSGCRKRSLRRTSSSRSIEFCPTSAAGAAKRSPSAKSAVFFISPCPRL